MGVGISINADDALMFETNILREYELCRSVLRFSDDQIASVARNSIKASGAPAAIKRAAEIDIDQWML
jgi:adenosine deaminase